MEKLIIKTDDPAVIELSATDPYMKKLVHTIGDIELPLRPDYLLSLVRSIVGQQISVQAATAIFGRLETLLDHQVTAQDILDKSDYLERRKNRYSSFDSGKGKAFENGELTLEDLRNYAFEVGEPRQISGKQEYFENLLNRFI